MLRKTTSINRRQELYGEISPKTIGAYKKELLKISKTIDGNSWDFKSFFDIVPDNLKDVLYILAQEMNNIGYLFYLAGFILFSTLTAYCA